MVGWHHRLNRHQFEQAPGDGEGQGSLICFSPWDCKELDMPEQLNNNNKGAEKSNGCLDPQIPSCCRNIPLEGIRKSSSEQRCVMVCTTSPSNLYVEVLTSSITVLCSVTSVLSHPFRPYGLYPPGSSVRGILQAVFLTQGSNQGLLHLPHCSQVLYHWATGEGQPLVLHWPKSSFGVFPKILQKNQNELFDQLQYFRMRLCLKIQFLKIQLLKVILQQVGPLTWYNW